MAGTKVKFMTSCILITVMQCGVVYLKYLIFGKICSLLMIDGFGIIVGLTCASTLTPRFRRVEMSLQLEQPSVQILSNWLSRSIYIKENEINDRSLELQ